jgi:hypothetical protein
VLRWIRIVAGVVLILAGVSVVIYGISVKISRKDYGTAAVCAIAGFAAIALGLRISGVNLD